jgi:uncharacterized protein (TIGR04255 family)
MSFPKQERVKYKNNPLIEVVCQLRFPRILTISEKSPADFQELIRDEFPRFEERTEYAYNVFGNSVQSPQIVSSDSVKNYFFESADREWRINLTNSFIALTCNKYDSHEQFFSKFEKPLIALEKIYKPAFYERVGLRYVNAIHRSMIGMEGVPWCDLIEAPATAFLSQEHLMNEVTAYEGATEFLFKDNIKVRLITKLVELTNDNQVTELCFVVDNDLFYEYEIAMGDAMGNLHKLHKSSTDVIESIFSPKLKSVLEAEL